MKAIVVVVLVLAVFGTAGYFGYRLFDIRQLEKQRAYEAEQREKEGAVATPAPPDPGLEEFRAAVALAESGKLGEAHQALTEFIRGFPESSKVQDAVDALGGVNADILFSSAKTPDKVEYVVESGDTLVGIAKRFGTTAELIMRVNAMDSTLLRIGDRLLVPGAEYSIHINRGAQIVDVYRDGVYFRRYRPLEFQLPSGDVREAKVSEKMAWDDGKRVAFGSKEYLGSTRWMLLGSSDYLLYEHPEGDGDVDIRKPARGIRLESPDMREIHAIVPAGARVVIE